MRKKEEKVSTKVQEQTIKGQVRPKQNNLSKKYKSKIEEDFDLKYREVILSLDDETFALSLANMKYTTDDWNKGHFKTPRYFALPKQQLTKEELISLSKGDVPDDTTIVVYPLEACIDNFVSGYYTDLEGVPIKAQDAEQYAVIIYGIETFVKKLIERYSGLISIMREDCLETEFKRC